MTSTDDKAFISGPITEPRLALTPQERAWVEELDEYGWSYGDIMLQRDECCSRAQAAEVALDRVRAVIAPRTAHDCPSCGVLAREVEAAIEGQP